jgi:hypothetical protein
MLVSHALAYVTASKNGVSEPEIEDFISLDDKVASISPKFFVRSCSQLSQFFVVCGGEG